MAIPYPEPRGHPGNLGLLFADHAEEARTAIVDLREPGAPLELSFRELDARCNAFARGLVRAGLKAGDRWCLCAARWQEALEADAAPLVVLESTHQATLLVVSAEDLKRHALHPS